LHLINDNLKNFCKTLQDFPNMPEPQQVWNVIPGNRLLQEETDYDVEELKRRVNENKARFNGEQLGAFNEVMDSVDNNLGKMIFIHSAGGCGKTFVCNTLDCGVWRRFLANSSSYSMGTQAADDCCFTQKRKTLGSDSSSLFGSKHEIGSDS
ncbi:hypothetical protein J132_01056, partial [Termitomyces sp. J132]